MTSLIEKLSSSAFLSRSSVIELSDAWQKGRVLKSKESLIRAGQRDTDLYFVLEGCVRLFVIDNQGNDKNIGFAYGGSIITSFQSFITGEVSNLHIQAVLPTELVSISKLDLNKLIVNNPEIANWYRLLLEQTLSGHIQRQVELLTLDPQQRYEVFHQRSGFLVNSIPLKLIASYLNMTPETLSRIRARIS